MANEFCKTTEGKKILTKQKHLPKPLFLSRPLWRLSCPGSTALPIQPVPWAACAAPGQHRAQADPARLPSVPGLLHATARLPLLPPPNTAAPAGLSPRAAPLPLQCPPFVPSPAAPQSAAAQLPHTPIQSVDWITITIQPLTPRLTQGFVHLPARARALPESTIFFRVHALLAQSPLRQFPVKWPPSPCTALLTVTFP